MRKLARFSFLLSSFLIIFSIASATTTFAKSGRMVVQTEKGEIVLPPNCEALLTSAVPSSWVDEMREKGRADNAQSKRLREVVQNNGFASTALNQEIIRNHNDKYTVVTGHGEFVTDQAQSGRCWLFAGLNMVRSTMIAEQKLPEDFEFSQNYLHFFSMLERSNEYLEQTIKVTAPGGAAKGAPAPILKNALTPEVSDGGFFEYFNFLVAKYGMVPKDVMPETISSERTATLLTELNQYLASAGAELLTFAQERGRPKTAEAAAQYVVDARKIKERALRGVWRILSTHLGDPPKSFEWRTEGHERNVNLTIKTPAKVTTYTPLEFAEKFVKYNPADYVVVANFPNRRAGRVYEIEGSAIGPAEFDNPKYDVRFLNVSMDRLEELTVAAIEHGQPVWYTADIGRDVDHNTGIMHPQIFERDGVYGMSEGEQMKKMTRRQLSLFGMINQNHAMLLTGLDRPAPKGPVIKFRNENSWGDEVGSEGIYHMYREWFRANAFAIVVHKNRLSTEEKKLWNGPANTDKPYMY